MQKFKIRKAISAYVEKNELNLEKETHRIYGEYISGLLTMREIEEFGEANK